LGKGGFSGKKKRPPSGLRKKTFLSLRRGEKGYLHFLSRSEKKGEKGKGGGEQGSNLHFRCLGERGGVLFSVNEKSYIFFSGEEKRENSLLSWPEGEGAQIDRRTGRGERLRLSVRERLVGER